MPLDRCAVRLPDQGGHAKGVPDAIFDVWGACRAGARLAADGDGWPGAKPEGCRRGREGSACGQSSVSPVRSAATPGRSAPALDELSARRRTSSGANYSGSVARGDLRCRPSGAARSVGAGLKAVRLVRIVASFGFRYCIRAEAASGTAAGSRWIALGLFRVGASNEHGQVHGRRSGRFPGGARFRISRSARSISNTCEAAQGTMRT